VQLDQGVAGDDVMGKYTSSDSTSPYMRFNDFWGRWTKTGVHGDPTTASAEKGKVIYEAAVNNLVELVTEWRAWPLAERQDQHKLPVQAQIRW
jgi:creatinine amidohydrolase